MIYATVKRDHAGAWRYSVKAANHQIISQSEGYSRRWSATRAVRKNEQVAFIQVYDRDGQFEKTIELR